MKERVRLGFIGCGGNARGHMRRIGELPDAELVAVCDVVEELARAAASETGAEAYTDLRKMLDRPDLDAVYISIPVFAHGEPEFEAIERGLPFLVEKPVALEMETAREIERRVLDAGVLTAVGYQLRYSGTVDLAREMTADQPIGLVSGKYWCDTGTGDPTRWIRRMGQSGGQLLEQATHTIDMMRCLVGEVSEVYCAATSRVLREIDCPDFTVSSLRFENGAVGSLTTSWAYAQGWGNANVVDLLFGEAALQWTHGRLSLFKDGQVQEFTPPSGQIDAIFVEAVKRGDGSAIRSPYSDGVKSMAVSIALNQSARERRPVAIHEV
jgi:myo-inositol 2-dehydrogenase/D-chiro-inositol 1-dehydrogenase